MSKEESCCPICQLADKYLAFIKSCENENELEWCVRQVVEKSYNQGFKDCLIGNIQENIAFLEALEEDELEGQDTPNLRVADNLNTNKH